MQEQHYVSVMNNNIWFGLLSDLRYVRRSSSEESRIYAGFILNNSVYNLKLSLIRACRNNTMFPWWLTTYGLVYWWMVMHIYYVLFWASCNGRLNSSDWFFDVTVIHLVQWLSFRFNIHFCIELNDGVWKYDERWLKCFESGGSNLKYYETWSTKVLRVGAFSGGSNLPSMVAGKFAYGVGALFR